MNFFRRKPKETWNKKRQAKAAGLVKDLAEFQNARLQQMTTADSGFYRLHADLMKTLGVLCEYIKAQGKTL